MSDEQNEILVYMDFNTKVEDELFAAGKEFKIIGVNTGEPVLQLGNQVFQGEWKDSLGTHIMFEEDDYMSQDPIFSETPQKQIRYFTKTNKTLHMSRIFVNPVVSSEDGLKGEGTTNSENAL